MVTIKVKVLEYPENDIEFVNLGKKFMGVMTKHFKFI